MPFYVINGLRVHVKMSGRAPAPCMHRVERQGIEQHCRGISAALCDWEVTDGATCDMPICAEHAAEVGKDRHYCPRHAAEHRAREPELPFEVR